MADRFPPDRPNPPDLVPFGEARASVLERVAPLPVTEVGLGDALGTVLAADVAAAEDLPPFANSAMDGFAVRGADLAGAGEDAPVALKVTGEVFAGTGRLPTVEQGGAARIMTGGALPPGADTVVPVEQDDRRRRHRAGAPRPRPPPVRPRGRRGRPPGHGGAGAGPGP